MCSGGPGALGRKAGGHGSRQQLVYSDRNAVPEADTSAERNFTGVPMQCPASAAALLDCRDK